MAIHHHMSCPDDCVEQCERGLTPNPDLACNRHIKFDSLLRFAAGLGADAVATGHHARLRQLEDGELEWLSNPSTHTETYMLPAENPRLPPQQAQGAMTVPDNGTMARFALAVPQETSKFISLVEQ